MTDHTNNNDRILGPPSEEEWDELHARKRGIFTDADRKYLAGVQRYEDHENATVNRSRRRKDIRERTIHGLKDLFYLARIDRDQWDDIFDEMDGTTNHPRDLRVSVSRLIQFVYQGMDGDEKWLEETVRAGVTNAERAMDEADRYGPGSVDVAIDVSPGYNLDRIAERLEEGDPEAVTVAEIGALAKAGRLDPDDLEVLEDDGATALPFFDGFPADDE